MALTIAPNGHVITQSEQFFGGFQLHISIDHNIKNNWSCPSCGCNNMGKSKLCGLCGLLNPKYICNPKNMHKKSMVTQQRTKLLSSKDIFKKLKLHFPQFRRYKINSRPGNKRRKSEKSPMANLIDTLDLNTSNNTHFNYYSPKTIKSKSGSTKHTVGLSFIDSVFGNINFSNPFGVETVEVPTIISDEDEEDLPLSPISDELIAMNDNIKNNMNNNMQTFLTLSNKLNSINKLRGINPKGLDKDLLPDIIPKHERQMSHSAPSTPPSRIPKRDRDRISINKNIRPLIFGVIHTPAPSRSNRKQIVLRNIENIVKFEFDGAFFINHGYSANHLVEIILEVHNKYPKLWLGANLMGIPDKKIFKFVKSNKLHKVLNGVWCENSGIELEEDELDDIFVHNFGRKQSMINSNALHVFDDTKKEDIIDTPRPLCTLIENTSNISCVSSGSTKSNNSESKKKRVTFSTLTNSLIQNGNGNGSPSRDSTSMSTPKMKPITTCTSTKPILNNTIAIANKKKDDSFARSRLIRMKKYKFNGLYFGGVDLKANNCIKIPSQKSIRTRRRTYSTDVGGCGDKKGSPRSPRSPATPKPKTIKDRFKKDKKQKTSNRYNRSASHHSGSQQYNINNKTQRNGGASKKSTSRNRNGRKDSIKLRKSLSTNIISDDDTVLATISSEDDTHHMIRQKIYKRAAIPKSIKTKSATSYKYKIRPKYKHKNKYKNSKHNHNHNGHNYKSNKQNHQHKKRKKVYSMTDSEINEEEDDIENAIDASFWPSNLAVAKSLELSEVKPKSPKIMTPLSHDSMESPPPLPSTPLSTKNIKLHNLALHRPIDMASDSMDDQDIAHELANILSHSQSMPHNSTPSAPILHHTQLSHESKSSSHSFNSDGSMNGDAHSVYSHTSQVSQTWSDYGSVNETLDDYFEALNILGKFASKGYMDVITTSGKGKNIDIKLKALKEACRKKCLLAVASGVRIENIETFLPYVDILMVSTCISNDFHSYDVRKMAKFKRTIDTYFANQKTK